MKAANVLTVTFTAKGQVVIPVQVRRLFDIGTGTRAIIMATGDGIFIKPVTTAMINNGYGILKANDGASVAEERALYKREERKTEDARARRRS
jgi:AbrB family looped-hinge helix DNA binding protein